MQVFVGELFISRSMHRNITNALTMMLHFLIDAISAFFVALVVQTVCACCFRPYCCPMSCLF